MEFSIIGGGSLMSNSIILIINTRLLYETTKNNIFQNFPNLGGSCQTSYGKFHNFLTKDVAVLQAIRLSKCNVLSLSTPITILFCNLFQIYQLQFKHYICMTDPAC